MHHIPSIETYKIDLADKQHFGGDIVLIDNFLRVIKGEEESIAPLNAGILSALMCLKTRQSAETHTFKSIHFA